MKKILVVMLAVAMVFAFAACGSDEPEEEVKTEFAIGEVADVDGVKYTVTEVTYSQGDEWDSPAEGKEYVIVNVSIENTSEEDASYNTFDWTMVNAQGQEDETSFSIIDTDTNLGSGTLKPGGTKSGTMVFEEPKDDGALKLLYYANVMFDEEPAFEVTIR